MLRLRCIASPETNLFIKTIAKLHKSRQSAFRAFRVSARDSQILKDNGFKKIAKYQKLAMQEKLDVDDFLTKEQDVEEVESIFKEIAQGDAAVENKLQLLFYEIMIKREEDSNVPKHLNKKHWEELLRLKTLYKRNKYLNFLHKTEKKKESERIKDALKKRDKELFLAQLEKPSHMYYGLSGYSMFLRIYVHTLVQLQDLKAQVNKLFAPPVIFDCSYQNYMDAVKTKYCAHQMLWSVQQNRLHPNPCTLQFFNLKENDLLMKYLKTYMRDIDSICEIYANSYLDMYPKERLVYLTPHTKHYLTEPRSDDIYIIGAFVDKGDGVQASLAKAKEKGLRMAKFPLDKYLLWKQGTKSLTLNNVVSILLDLRYYNNWEMALRSVPSRNIQSERT